MAKRFYPQHLKERRRRIFLAIAGFGLLIFLGGGVGVYRWKSSQVAWKDYTNEELGVRLDYPETFVEEALPEQYKEADIVFRITKNAPSAFFSLRYEDSLGVMKSFGGKNILDQLVTAVNRRYPDRFPDYEKIDYKNLTLAGEEAAQFDFIYTGADGKTRAKQRLIIVVKEETAYYLAAQAPESEFKESEKEFDKIMSSFEFIK